MSEEYELLQRLQSQGDAERLCAALEHAGIPLMLQYVQDQETAEAAFKLMVPPHLLHSAYAVLSSHQFS